MTIAPILEGKDIFAQAETGSGKTAAFVIPILEQILRDEKHGEILAHESRYAILSPTRELAQQTYKVIQQFGASLGIKACCVIGGESIEKQTEQINKGVHILVGTPGRLMDLLKRKVVSFEHCQGVVFDEADRLFDMGFQKDIEYILSKASRERQLIMLSATSNQEVLRTAYKFHSSPVELRLNEDSLVVDHIDHKLAMITQEEKFSYLVHQLREKEDMYAIVFCNTQFQTHLVAEWLMAMGFKAQPISGRLAQNRRTKLMEDFRSKKVTVLVCTDVAARGLDIKDVNLVINYDLPIEAANYVHRIGRTGRAGSAGEAISFCAHEDCENLDAIYELIDAKIEKMDIEDSDFATDLCKKPFIDRKTLRVTDRNAKPESKDKKKTSTKGKNTKTQTKKTSPDRNKAEVISKEVGKMTEKPRTPRVDRRFFEYTSYSLDEATKQAQKFFRIEDESIIANEVLSEGRKKFFIFGAKETKYKFFVKPIYKRILLPYLIEMIKAAQLELFVKVSFRPGSLMISFSGKDEKLLLENRNELLFAFEHLIKTYLYSKVVLHKNLRIQVKCFKDQAKSKPQMSDKDLVDLAETVKVKVLDSKAAVKLKPMNSAQRRIVHMHFENDKEIKTSSVGEGRYKVVEISPM
jgi:superfamily II DNA/RNA helicase